MKNCETEMSICGARLQRLPGEARGNATRKRENLLKRTSEPGHKHAAVQKMQKCANLVDLEK